MMAVTEELLNEARKALESLDAEGLVSRYADDFVFKDVSSGNVITSREKLLEYYQRLFAMPDVSFTDVSFFSCGDRAAGEWTWSGTKGDGGTRFSVKGASIFELREGRIASEMIFYDPRPAME
jgi:steroid delta-isomerase-like uncharacterized protein